MFEIIEEANRLADKPHINIMVEYNNGKRGVKADYRGSGEEMGNMLAAVITDLAKDMAQEMGISNTESLAHMMTILTEVCATHLAKDEA